MRTQFFITEVSMPLGRIFQEKALFKPDAPDAVLDVTCHKDTLFVQLGNQQGMRYVAIDRNSGREDWIHSSRCHLAMEKIGNQLVLWNEDEVFWCPLEGERKVTALKWREDFTLGPLAHKVAIVGEWALIRTELGKIEGRSLVDPGKRLNLVSYPGWGIRGGRLSNGVLRLILPNRVGENLLVRWKLDGRKSGENLGGVGLGVVSDDERIVSSSGQGVSVRSWEGGEVLAHFSGSLARGRLTLAWPMGLWSDRLKRHHIYHLEEGKKVCSIESKAAPLLTSDYLIYPRSSRSLICDAQTGKVLQKIKGEVHAAHQVGQALLLARGPLGLTRFEPKKELEKLRGGRSSPTTKPHTARPA